MERCPLRRRRKNLGAGINNAAIVVLQRKTAKPSELQLAFITSLPAIGVLLILQNAYPKEKYLLQLSYDRYQNLMRLAATQFGFKKST